MTFWSDMDYEMHPVPLDLDTADRLLAGAVLPEDAPPGFARVAQVLEAASAEPTPDELAREPEVVAMVVAAVQLSSGAQSLTPRRSYMPFALSRPRITAAFVAAAFACTAGLASAGSLPGAAQDIASAMLAKVGVTVPGPNENAGTHPNERGSDTSSGAAARSDIADLATSTELTGVDRGAAISTAASDGMSQAGEHGAGSHSSAAVQTPNTGGTGTADTASEGASSHGTTTADAASGGHSSAGSGNAGGGQNTADSASGGHSSAGSANAGGGQDTANSSSGGHSSAGSGNAGGGQDTADSASGGHSSAGSANASGGSPDKP
jgi:hypothetical protein